jgi:hypothetical protein
MTRALFLTVALTIAIAFSFHAAAAVEVADLKWSEFVRDCGVKAQESNKVRSQSVFKSKYEGKVIGWFGTVNMVQEQPLGDGYLISVTMRPSEAPVTHSDLKLFVPEKLKDRVLPLDKGNKIAFIARITTQGGSILDHQLDCLLFEKR